MRVLRATWRLVQARPYVLALPVLVALRIMAPELLRRWADEAWEAEAAP